jgi:hypothetical protein
MNRRGFLGLLVAAPVAALVPAPTFAKVERITAVDWGAGESYVVGVLRKGDLAFQMNFDSKTPVLDALETGMAQMRRDVLKAQADVFNRSYAR